ncbi:DNA-binding phosphoprotein [Pigeonpox virus]|nr:DNA-binding phosphoprotein [Pigeonpox virus]
MKNNLYEEKMNMNKKQVKIQSKSSNNKASRFTCLDAVQYAKALCTKDTKIVKSVKLTPSHHNLCSNISVTLEPKYNEKLVSPFILVEGEGKIYQTRSDNFSREESFFLKIRPSVISPILHQMMECIYNDLGYLDPENTMDEKTFKDGYIYINKNKMSSTIIEYTRNNKEVTGRKTLSSEVEQLSKKDPQMVKAVLVASIFFENAVMCKISFNLKKLIMEKVCRKTLIDTNGEVISVVTSGDDDIEDESGEFEYEPDGVTGILEERHDSNRRGGCKIKETDECDERSLFNVN